MSEPITAVIVGATPEEAGLLREDLDDLVQFIGAEESPIAGEAKIMATSPRVALLYLDHKPDEILALAKLLSRTSGSVVIVISENRDPDNILQAMRAGAKDFAYLDGGTTVDVRRALRSVEVGTGSTDIGKGKVVSVFGCKGGVGATTIATNLAGALLDSADEQSPTVLLDLDFMMGDVQVFLDIASNYSWQDLVNNVHRLDDQLLKQSLTQHPCGLQIVAQTDNPEESDEIATDGVAKSILLLRKHYDFVVLDGMRDFRESSLTALDASDKILLVMTQDVPALKNANRCLKLFKRLGYENDQVKLVVNRFTRRSELDLETIADALQYPVSATVVNDFPTVIDAINKGSLLVRSSPRADVTADFQGLVPMIRGEQSKKRQGRSTGIFGRWGRK